MNWPSPSILCKQQQQQQQNQSTDESLSVLFAQQEIADFTLD